MVRLHLNENTAGCSPAVIRAIRALAPEDFARYPDIPAATSRCAAHFGVNPDQVLLTNGLDDGVYVLARRVREMAAAEGLHNFEAVVADPSFDSYTTAVETMGGVMKRVRLHGDFSFPAEAVIDAITPSTRLIFINDPNNPGGRSVGAGAIERVARAAPRAIVFADETYADFRGQRQLGPPLDTLPNVIVGRTFSKAYGLAGFRVGALVGSRALIEPMRRHQPVFAVNTLAVLALQTALEDPAFYAASVAASAAAREIVYAWCAGKGLTCWRSDANFVLIRVGERVAAIVQALTGRGVLVRDFSSAPGCEGCLRLSAPRAEDVRRGLTMLGDLLSEPATR